MKTVMKTVMKKKRMMMMMMINPTIDIKTYKNFLI